MIKNLYSFSCIDLTLAKQINYLSLFLLSTLRTVLPAAEHKASNAMVFSKSALRFTCPPAVLFFKASRFTYTSGGHRCEFCNKLKLWVQERFYLILVSRFHQVEAVVNSFLKFRKCIVKLKTN